MSLGREYPVFPLPAVSGVIFDDRDRILLIRRANPPAKGKWSLPGGVVKLGEELAEALKREIREECDLTVLVGPLVWASSRIIRDGKDHIQYHYVLLDYLCRSENSNVTVGADASEARKRAGKVFLYASRYLVCSLASSAVIISESGT